MKARKADGPVSQSINFSCGIQVRMGFGSSVWYVWGSRMLELGSGWGYRLAFFYFVGTDNLKLRKKICSLKPCFCHSSLWLRSKVMAIRYQLPPRSRGTPRLWEVSSYCTVPAPNATPIRPFTRESGLPLDNALGRSSVIIYEAGCFPSEAGHLERKIGQILITEDIRA